MLLSLGGPMIRSAITVAAVVIATVAGPAAAAPASPRADGEIYVVVLEDSAAVRSVGTTPARHGVSVPVGGSTSFGFLGSWNGAVNSAPTDVTCTS
jgi:hypothetical protein